MKCPVCGQANQTCTAPGYTGPRHLPADLLDEGGTYVMAQPKEEKPLYPEQTSRVGKTGYIGDVRTFKPAATRQEERDRIAKTQAKAKAGPPENKAGNINALRKQAKELGLSGAGTAAAIEARIGEAQA